MRADPSLTKKFFFQLFTCSAKNKTRSHWNVVSLPGSRIEDLYSSCRVSRVYKDHIVYLVCIDHTDF